MPGLDDYLNPQNWVRMGLGPYTALPQQQPANPYAGTGLEQFRASQGAAPVTTMPPNPANVSLMDAIAQHMVQSPFQAMQSAQQSAANLQAGFPAASTDVPSYDPGGPLSVAQLMFGRMPFAGRGMAGAGGGRLTQPTSAFRDAPNPSAPFPQWAEEYPPIGAPVEALKDKPKFPGETYLEKGYSPEGLEVEKARDKIIKDMKKKGYEPYFDPAQRSYVDPSGYPPANVNTLTEVVPKQEKTVNRYLETIDAPQTRAALREAYKRGGELGNAHDWYAVGQMEHEFVKELGPEAGRRAFMDRFVGPMATTTSGQNPTSNLLAGHYLDYLTQKGLPMPQGGWDTPVAVGGRRFATNVKNYSDALARGGEGGLYAGLGIDQPKMHNFSRNFIGDLLRATMDEQMAGGMFKWNKAADPGFAERARVGAYGLVEAPLHAEAAAAGVNPANFQDVAWAGFKGEPGKPMISHVNDAIERTHRLTGMPRSEIFRRAFIRGEIPLYGVGGLMGLGVTQQALQQQE